MMMRSGSTKRSMRPASSHSGVLVDDVLEALKDFINGLKELGLVGMILLKVCEDAVQIGVVNHFLTSFLLFTLLS